MGYSKMTSLAEGVPQISNKKNTMVKEGCPKKLMLPHRTNLHGPLIKLYNSGYDLLNQYTLACS